MEHKITIMKYQLMFPRMTKKLFDEKERIYQITVICIRLDELQTKGAVLQKMGKPTKNGTKMTFAPVQSAGEYEAEIQRILEDGKKLGMKFEDKEEVEDDETGENESSDAENQTAESEPETAEREQTEETEVIEAVYGTRKEYMDRLSEQGMAEYMADEYKSHRLLVTDLENTWNLCKWLSEKVDRFGQPIEEE